MVAVLVAGAWRLGNLIPNTALPTNHRNVTKAEDFTGPAASECGFHFTLPLAGTILANSLYGPVRMAATTPIPNRPSPRVDPG